jgi:hypothetical protein
VTTLSEKVIRYQRKDETMEEALESYLHDCEERYAQLQESFGKFMEIEKVERLEDIAILVNSLMQMTLENPI